MLLFTYHYPETYKPKSHFRRQSGMNFGCVIVNGVSNNVQIMKDFKRYAARLHKNAFRCYNQIKV